MLVTPDPGGQEAAGMDQAPELIARGKVPSAVTATVLMLLHHHRPGDD